MRLRLGDDLPPSVGATLAAAGFQSDPEAPFCLSGPEAWRALPAELPFAVVGLDPADAAAESARAAGAVAVWAHLPPPAAVLAPLLAFAARAHTRERTLERRFRRANAELASTRDFLTRLIDATPNPVMAADLRGRVLVFNRAAELALGFAPDWATAHMHVTEVYADPQDARRVLAELRRAPGGAVSGMETRLRASNGEIVPVRLSAAEVHAADGTPLATVGVFVDRRAELQLTSRLEETTEQLIATEKRASAMEVAGGAAHELNQPLTAVMGTIEMLQLRGDLPEDAMRKLEKSWDQLQRMAEIVRQLARTSRPRSTGYVGNARILDLHGSQD